MGATRVGTASPNGTGYTRAVVGAFEVTRLVFPPSFRHGSVEPERGYLAVVLDGAVQKSFAGDDDEHVPSSHVLPPSEMSHRG